MIGPFLILARLAEISFVDNSKERLNTKMLLWMGTAASPPTVPVLVSTVFRDTQHPSAPCCIAQCSRACFEQRLRTP